MNADAITIVERLREAARCNRRGSIDVALGAWLADGLERLLNRDAETFAAAFGLPVGGAGGHPWWVQDRRAKMTAALRDFAARYCAGDAKALAAHVEQYSRRYWAADRLLAELPQSIDGTPRAALFSLFREADGAMPTSSKQLARLLSGSNARQTLGQVPPPDGVQSTRASSESKLTEHHDETRKNQDTVQRRRQSGRR